MARTFIAVLLGLTTSSCYVNRAVVDPWSYAPLNHSCYWEPDSKASNLTNVCRTGVELPSEQHALSLGEVLDIALINNPQTKISWAQARQAAAAYGQSQSTAFPTINLDYYYLNQRGAYLSNQFSETTIDNETTLIISDVTEWGPQAQLSYTIFDFGQRRYTSEAARYALYFANYNHNSALQSLMETITIDYYNYLAEKKLLEANEADLATAEEVLEAADLCLECGVKNISDMLQSRTIALQSQIQLSQRHRTLQTAYARLLDDMGLPANASITLQKLPFIDPEEIHLNPLNAYIEVAMQYRPDLMAARANLCSSEMSLKAAKRLWTPTLNYSLEFGRTYFKGGFHDNYDYVSTFTLSMPIFTGFNIRNTVRLASAKLDESEAVLEQAELSVIKEVTTAHYNVTVAYQTLKTAILLLESANEQYKAALSQYKSGINTILDVNAAQSALFNARATHAQAIQQWFTSLATLTYSTGLITYNIEDLP